MRYISTRGGGTPQRFCDILLEGLAPDGGLYLPERYPDLTGLLPRWHRAYPELGYAGLAFEVLRLFIDDIDEDDLRGICERAYSYPKFSDERIVPLTRLSDGTWLAHTSLGPTAAFKDMAMQLLGELFDYVLTRRDQTLTILGATSGDTGSAAEYALLGKPRLRVFMLTPAGRMTPFQQAQMFSLDDPGIVNLAVDGVFDDCQDLVKAVNADADFKATHRIGAVNSINWARLLAQVVYYVAAWIQATGSPDEQVSFAVPSGNFGNICAAHIARCMGLPVATLVLATNENDVLDEFVRTGVYRVRGAADTHETSSPSMDISKASNFERFVFDLLGRDGARTARLFGSEIPQHGFFDLSTDPVFAEVSDRYGFRSGSSTHADRIATIREVYATDGVVIDPHTADGVKVARESGAPDVIVIETALPVKFSATIVEALGTEPPRPARFAGLEDLPRHVTALPNDAEALKRLIASR
ncbi:MAG: threonine synthase [Propionibacteriaceae bacterium]|nr:threonine synthase [Propionibacteriaceae bacterium]